MKIQDKINMIDKFQIKVDCFTYGNLIDWFLLERVIDMNIANKLQTLLSSYWGNINGYPENSNGILFMNLMYNIIITYENRREN